MALPDFSMRQLLEAGVHFGHQKHRWNPKMEQYIFGVRNNIHIVDLAQTVPALYQALQIVSDTVAEGGRVLFVGTKRQAAPIVAQAAQQCAQYYVNSRWLGGTLTNWQTISKSISRLRELEHQEAEGTGGLTKKELLHLTRERERLDRDLGGIKDMGNLPNLLFVIDTNKEAIALHEARRLGIPIIAIVDTNSDPDNIDVAIPGNDDASRALELYCSLISKAAIDGISRSSAAHGADLGATEEVLPEPVLAETVPVEPVAPAATTEAPAAEQSAPEPVVEASAPVAAEVPADPVVEAPTPAVDAAPADPAPEIKEVPAEPVVEVQETPEPTVADDTGPLFATPSAPADDLKKISGVGQVLESKLNGLGVTTYAQIAGFTPEDITRVDDKLSFKGRIDRDNWIQQATDLMAQKS